MAEDFKNDFEKQLTQSLQYGFVHNTRYNNRIYSPKLVINNPNNSQYVLTDIQEALDNAVSFHFNVAFVTSSGIKLLKAQLLDLAKRGGYGRIMISPYLGFNEPDALRELLTLHKVEVRLTSEKLNMHAKIYMFDQNEEQVVISGSSNLTGNAFKMNYEWNVRLTSADNGEFISQTRQEYDRIWEKSTILTAEVIADYAKKRVQLVQQEALVETEDDATYEQKIEPNNMQKKALEGLQKIREEGAERALVISATGTGKTYLSAFDVKNYNPDKMLFIVHRKQILTQAEKSFRQVVGFTEEESCIYESGMAISDKRFVFATVQTLAQDKNLSQLAADSFDYILIDEVHKAGAASYLKIMDYFKPDFYLGMTATPERTDGQSIYDLFDHNIAYEIRLQQALEENMLCPFLYFGVTELTLDGELIDNKAKFSHLVSDQRVDHIIEKIKYYGHGGDKIKGLMFCSRKDEAHELSAKLNQCGYHTKALTGEDKQEIRLNTIEALKGGDLDYILTVDIFNEGIDIPEINQVVMLRQTQSSIIFIQQLGRGLRKHPSKNNVVIIDFIGNYSNNYLIPMALFGDKSMNKDNVRRKLANPNQLNGLTTINFERIAKEKVFDAISSASLSILKVLKESYQEVKNRIGRIPLMFDFINQNSIDPEVFFENQAFKHYGDVIRKFEKDTVSIFFTPYGEKVLFFLTTELLNGKRLHEMILLKGLVDNKGYFTKNEFYHELNRCQLSTDERVIASAERVLSLVFFKDADQKKYGHKTIEIGDEAYRLVTEFRKLLENADFMILVQDIIQTAFYKGHEYDGNQLVVGKKYSRKDVCRLLLWDKDESSTIYGYRVKYGTCPIFVTYHKSKDISEGTQYADGLINERTFHWYTRSKLHLASDEVKAILESQARDIAVHLFVKKEDGEGSDFYYLGEVEPDVSTAIETTMPNNKDLVVTMNLELEQAIPNNLFRYLVETA